MTKVFCPNCYTDTRPGRACQWCGARLEKRKKKKGKRKPPNK